MGAKKIVDNNMSQDALLRSVKPAVVAPQIDSSLKPNEKALAESILNTLLEQGDGGNDYLLKLTSKNTDALMGRIETYIDKVKDDFTSSELANVKTAILDAIQAAVDSSPKSIEVDEISKAVEQITQKLSIEIQTKLDQIISSIEELLETVQATAAPAGPAAPTAMPAVAPAAPEKEEEEEEEEEEKKSDAKDMSEFEAPSDKDEFTEEDLNEIQEFINTQFVLLTTLVTDVSAQITENINAVNTAVSSLQSNMQESINSLQPTSKDKKAAKQAKKAQNELNRIIKEMDEAVKKIQNFVDNFVQVLIDNFQTFMNGVFKVLFTFFLKLMIGIVFPFVAVLALALYLLEPPLSKIVQNVVIPILDKLKDIVEVVLDFLKPIRDFLIDVFKPVFTAISEVLAAFFRGIGTVAEEIGKGLGLFVKSVLKVLKLLMDGIATGAFVLGKALVRFATACVNVLALFMEGMATYAKKIGEGLGKFVTIVLDVMCELFEGFKTQARAIGEAIGTVVLGVVNVVSLIVEFAENVVGILVEIVGTIRDFFAGFRSKAKAIGETIGNIVHEFFKGFETNAKKIGEKVSEIVLVSADIILKILKAIDGAMSGMKKFMMMYIVAPINGIKRKLNVFLLDLSDISFELPTGLKFETFDCKLFDISLPVGFEWSRFYPLSGIKNSMGSDAVAQAQQDKGKSIGELIGDEMDKMAEKLKKEEEEAKAAELARKLQEKKIEDMLNNVKLMEDMSNRIKEIHDKVVSTEGAKIDFSAIINGLQTVQDNCIEKTQIVGRIVVETAEVLNTTIKDEINNIKLCFDGLAQNITDGVASIGTNMNTYYLDILEQMRKTSFEEVMDLIKDSAKHIVAETELISYNILSKIDATKEELKESLAGFYQRLDEIVQLIQLLPAQIENVLNMLFLEFKAELVLQMQEIADNLQSSISELLEKYFTEISELACQIIDAIELVPEKVELILQEKIEQLKEFFDSTILPILQIVPDIKKSCDQIYDKLVHYATTLYDYVKQMLDLMHEDMMYYIPFIETLYAVSMDKFLPNQQATQNMILMFEDRLLEYRIKDKTELALKLNDIVDLLKTISEAVTESRSYTASFFSLFGRYDPNGDFPKKALERFVEFKDSVDNNFAQASNMMSDFETFVEEASLTALDYLSYIFYIAKYIIQPIPTGIFKILDWLEYINDNVESIVEAVVLPEENENMLEVSVQATVPDIQRIDNIDQIGKASTENLLQSEQTNPAEDIKADNKKAAKAQSKFQSQLMAYLQDMFGEVLQKLDSQSSQVVPIPLPTNSYSNMATMENM